MKKMKFLSLFLVLVMAGTLVLSACESAGGDSAANVSGTGNKSLGFYDYQDADGEYVGYTSGKYYEGETITFLTCGENAVYESEIIANTTTYEEGANQTYPQVINDDLQKRADKLEEDLGIILEETPMFCTRRHGGEFMQAVVNGNLSATEDYQVVVPCLYDGANLAVESHLYNLLDMDGLQIEAPWWNQQFNDSMTYADQLYFTIGDIGLVNKANTAAIFFNYDVWKKYELTKTFGGTPYELVRDGKWTMDVVFEAAQVLSIDTDHNNIINYKDEYGWSGQLDDMWSMFFSSGEKIASADADGYPAITMFNERSARVMEKLQEFVQNDTCYVSANDFFNVTNSPVDLTRGAFIDGRTLFFNDVVGTVAKLGDMEEHFGVVPEPKYDESQDNYHSLVNPWGSTCFAVPVSVKGDKLTMTIDALNYMGAFSKNTLAVNYQDVVLSYMKTRDDESAEMINDYILPNRACDVGMVYQWGGLGQLLQEMASKSIGSFSSQYDAKADVAEAALQITMEFYKSKENQ